MSKVWLVDLEAVETRYTAQWKTHVPKLLQKAGHDVQIISGPTDIPTATTPGAFLNFGGTNIYKSSQVEQMGRLFCSGSVHAGDHFVFTDAWHPGIINLKYMSELLNIPVVTHGFWHAGSYDPQDFLGRLVGNKPWVRHAEKSYFWAFDHNYFATEFHVKLFIDELLMDGYKEENPWYEEDYAERYDSGKMVKTGWPMEYMDDVLTPYKNMPKRDLIVFPHRIAPEKQVEIFRDLKEQLPQYEFVVCQDQELTKNEYHNLLGEAKIVFSCSLQETLGIGCYEGALVDAIPMVPNRLSYEEMYDPQFKYPSMWTIDWNHYLGNRTVLRDHIVKTISNYESLLPKLKTQTQDLTNNFFSANEFLKRL
jgi:glycosyltransferase involved in cell wall biosynthesis